MRIIKVFASGIAVLVTLLVCVTVAGCHEATAESESLNPESIAAAEPGQELPSAPRQPSTTSEDDSEQPMAIDEPGGAAERAGRSSRPEPRQRQTATSREPDRAERAQRTGPRVEPSSALEPEVFETEGIGISRVTLARDIEDRTPVDPGTTFSVSDGGRIYAYLEVSNPDREQGALSVAWARADDPEDELSRVDVEVGAYQRWRTWAYTSRLDRPGRYLAIVRDQEGEIIARAPFEVTL